MYFSEHYKLEIGRTNLIRNIRNLIRKKYGVIWSSKFSVSSFLRHNFEDKKNLNGKNRKVTDLDEGNLWLKTMSQLGNDFRDKLLMLHLPSHFHDSYDARLNNQFAILLHVLLGCLDLLSCL